MRRLHGDGAGRKEHGTSAHRRSEVVVGFVLDLQVHGTWLILADSSLVLSEH
jgi:hypothetical protein